MKRPSRCDKAPRTHLQLSRASESKSGTSWSIRTLTSTLSAMRASESAQALRTAQFMSLLRRIKAGSRRSQQLSTTRRSLSILYATARRTLKFGSSQSEVTSGMQNCWHRTGPKRGARPFKRPAAVMRRLSALSSCASSSTMESTCSMRSSSRTKSATWMSATDAASRTSCSWSATSCRKAARRTSIMTRYASLVARPWQNSQSCASCAARCWRTKASWSRAMAGTSGNSLRLASSNPASRAVSPSIITCTRRCSSTAPVA
mmetsp:Transcript_26469/g.84194  ORF Transcript_26469/g.84194 Transcript_26469/m.84194 type:complete len:261 (-) Transcript_26469:92-874(-)